MACAQVQHQLFMRLSVQAGKNCPFTTFTHSLLRLMPPRKTPEKIDEKKNNRKAKNTDCVQAGRVVSPATSAHKTQRHQPFKYTTFLWNNTEPYKTSIAEGLESPSLRP